MVKRIVLGVSLAALIGLLVAGGIIRTVAKSGAEGDSHDADGVEAAEWLEIEGTVISTDAESLVVETGEGQEVVVDGRAWLFAQQEGFSLQPEDSVTLLGFYEEDPLAATGQRYEVCRINNNTTGEAVQLREQSGRPIWAGRGRRGGG